MISPIYIITRGDFYERLKRIISSSAGLRPSSNTLFLFPNSSLVSSMRSLYIIPKRNVLYGKDWQIEQSDEANLHVQKIGIYEFMTIQGPR